jgi:quercetin dioxygenase-like cupin family protein
MKVLPFTIPVPEGQTIIVQEEIQKHFYPHLHRHAEIQITWIKRGEGTLLAGNSIHPFKAGEIYVLGANLPHLFRSSPEYFDESNQLDVQELTIFLTLQGSYLLCLIWQNCSR